MYSNSITWALIGASNRDRTDDIGLGRTALYHLSYTRMKLVGDIRIERMTSSLLEKRSPD